MIYKKVSRKEAVRLVRWAEEHSVDYRIKNIEALLTKSHVETIEIGFEHWEGQTNVVR